MDLPALLPSGFGGLVLPPFLMGREERAEVRHASVRRRGSSLLHAERRVVDPIKVCLRLVYLRHGPAYRQPGLSGPHLRLTASVHRAVTEVGADGLVVAKTLSAETARSLIHTLVSYLSADRDCAGALP